jgi:hypothetical protein
MSCPTSLSAAPRRRWASTLVMNKARQCVRFKMGLQAEGERRGQPLPGTELAPRALLAHPRRRVVVAPRCKPPTLPSHAPPPHRPARRGPAHRVQRLRVLRHARGCAGDGRQGLHQAGARRRAARRRADAHRGGPHLRAGAPQSLELDTLGKSQTSNGRRLAGWRAPPALRFWGEAQRAAAPPRLADEARGVSSQAGGPAGCGAALPGSSNRKELW